MFDGSDHLHKLKVFGFFENPEKLFKKNDDKKFLEDILKIDAVMYQYFPSKSKNDETLIYLALRNDIENINYIPKKKMTKNFFFELLKKGVDAIILNALPDEQKTTDFMIECIKINNSTIEVFFDDFKNDEKFIVEVLKHNAKYFPSKIPKNFKTKQNLLYALKQNWIYMKDQPEFHEAMKDENFFLEAVSINVESLYHISAELKEKLIKKILERNGLCLEFYDVKIQQDVFYVQMAVNQNPESIQYASIELRSSEYFGYLLEKNGMLLKYFSEIIKNDFYYIFSMPLIVVGIDVP